MNLSLTLCVYQVFIDMGDVARWACVLGLYLDDVTLAYNELRNMTKCQSLLFSVGPVCLSPYRSDGRHAEWSGVLYPRAL